MRGHAAMQTFRFKLQPVLCGRFDDGLHTRGLHLMQGRGAAAQTCGSEATIGLRIMREHRGIQHDLRDLAMLAGACVKALLWCIKEEM